MKLRRIAGWIVVWGFVIFYPMLVSIYVTLPLFIGYAGYQLSRGLDGAGWRYLVVPLVYLVNLEINLSLPLLLSFLAVLIFYLLFYERLAFWKRCPVCVSVLAVSLIDLIYLGLITGYDFIFGTFNITINAILFYSLVMDIVVAVLL
ncbi:hypothetical protein [Nitratifractor sp.]